MDMVNLKKIQQKLISQKELLEARINKIDADLKQPNRLSKDFAEQAVETENDEVLVALKHESSEELKKIMDALKRIEADEYGQCLRCGEMIPEKRLEIVPHTNFCVGCLNEIDKQ